MQNHVREEVRTEGDGKRTEVCGYRGNVLLLKVVLLRFPWGLDGHTSSISALGLFMWDRDGSR